LRFNLPQPGVSIIRAAPHFLIGSYQRTTGDVALDADLPIRDVPRQRSIPGILAYDRTFDLFGQTGSVAIVLPLFPRKSQWKRRR
jgi:hypothetical protein